MCWYGIGSHDFKWQCVFYMLGYFLTLAQVRYNFWGSEIHATKVSTSVFLTLSIAIVPKTVLTFRATFLEIAKTYTLVH